MPQGISVTCFKSPYTNYAATTANAPVSGVEGIAVSAIKGVVPFTIPGNTSIKSEIVTNIYSGREIKKGVYWVTDDVPGVLSKMG